jgi:hypothetical protein
MRPLRLRSLRTGRSTCSSRPSRAALKQAGIKTVPGRDTAPLSPAWKDLYRHLNRTSWRIGLSRFAHYCSARGIDPLVVDDQVLAGYLEALL